MRRRVIGAVVVAGLAALAWAAQSTNFRITPEVIDQGGGRATSASFVAMGSIGGNAISADTGQTGTNQTGTASSTNYSVVGSIGDTVFHVPGGTIPPLTIATDVANPATSNESNTSVASIPMLQVRLRASGASTITISSIVLTATGLGHDTAEISNVNCHVDANRNGIVDGTELTFASQTTFSGDNGTATFTPSGGYFLSAGASVTLLFSYTWNGSPTAITAGDTFIPTLAFGAVSATDSLSNPVAAAGLPITGNTKTAVASGTAGSLAVTLDAQNPGGTAVPAGTTNEGWLRIRLVASSVENVNVTSIRLSASGTLHDALEVNSVSLWDDTAGTTPGQVDGADTSLVTGQVYSGDDGTVLLTIPAGQRTCFSNLPRLLLVAYSLSSSATPGATGTARIAANADIVAAGAVSAAAVVPTGAPIGSMRSIEFPPPSVTTIPGTPGSSSGGGCAATPLGLATPAGAPLGVLAPWLLLCAAFVLRRR